MKYPNEKILICALAALWLLPFGLAPLLDRATDFAKTENRNQAQWPEKFCWRKFPGEVELFYNDRIPFRAFLLRTVRKVHSRLLAQNESRVIIGKDSFLFYQDDQNRECCPYRQYIDDPGCRLRRHEIRRICCNFDLAFQDAANKHAQFLLVIPPSKINVYPDKLPPKRAFPRGKKVLTDQVCETMAREMPQIPVLNLECGMARSRQECPVPVYFPQDTHWNPCGAYFAVKGILDKLNCPWPKSWPAADRKMRIRWEPESGKDLLPMMQTPPAPCGKTPYPGDFPRMEIRKTALGLAEGDKLFRTDCPQAPDPRTVVVFRDSFAIALQPYLSSYFRRVYYCWSAYRPGIVAAFQPDLVVVECVSRFLPLYRSMRRM